MERAESAVDDLRQLLTRPPRSEDGGVCAYVSAAEDYCGNFGEQWNRFRAVQVDSTAGTDESHRRFLAETGWTPEDLRGKLLLDAGCGAGRFAEVALECGARVVAVDLSDAAYACARTLSRFPRERYLIVRADLFDLPLQTGVFDGVYSLGVLQHTPDPLRAVALLGRYVAPGGRLATWIYERRPGDLAPLRPRTWIRVATRTLGDRGKLNVARILTALFFPLGWCLSWLGVWGERLSAFLPYAARHHQGRGSFRRQWEYSVMDTFDWYGPKYEYRQREEDVYAAMTAAGLTRVRRLPARGMAIVGEAPGAGS